MKYSLQEALRELRSSKKEINESPKKFEDKDAEEEYFRHIQELSTDYEDPDAEEYEEDDYDEEDDIEESCTLKESNDIVTAVFKDNGFDKSEFEEAYPELMSRLEFDTREFDNRKNQLAYCDIYVKGKREDVEDFIQKSIWDYGCDTKEEAEELYGEGCIPTIIDESLKEDYLPRDIYSLCNVIPLDELDKDEVDYEAVEDLENQMGCKVLGILDSDVDELNYYYWCDDGYAYMGVPLTPDSNTYRWYSKDVDEIAELINGSDDDYDDLDESLKEDAKFVTAATILKKEQNKIFAQTTEEAMRKMVLDILGKNKDKMKPENYNAVVKTMTNCPKRAVPSTVWTMLNPSQKVGK